MLSVSHEGGHIRVFEADSGDEIADIQRYLLSVQYAIDLPIAKNAHIGSSWFHPRLSRTEAALLIAIEQTGTFVSITLCCIISPLI